MSTPVAADAGATARSPVNAGSAGAGARRVKWGVIGSGGIARRRTIPEGIATAPNGRLVAVCNRSATANAEVAAQFGARAVGSVAELVASDIDAVYLATPAHLHLEQAVACARRNRGIRRRGPRGARAAQRRRVGPAEPARARGVLRVGPHRSEHRARRAVLKGCQHRATCSGPRVLVQWPESHGVLRSGLEPTAFRPRRPVTAQHRWCTREAEKYRRLSGKA